MCEHFVQLGPALCDTLIVRTDDPTATQCHGHPRFEPATDIASATNSTPSIPASLFTDEFLDRFAGKRSDLQDIRIFLDSPKAHKALSKYFARTLLQFLGA